MKRDREANTAAHLDTDARPASWLQTTRPTMQQTLWLALGLILGAILTAAAAVSIHRKRLAARVRAIRRAEEERRLKETPLLTGGLAHEIKNPLSTLSLNAQLLDEEVHDLDTIDDDTRHRITRKTRSLRREAERLRDILTDFLQFAGQRRLDARLHDLNILIDELIDFFVPQTLAAHIQLRASFPSQPANAVVDSALFKQALLNLLLNALHALQAEGQTEGKARELIVRLEPASPPAQRLHKIHVTDTGPGITPENLEQIFQPYFTTRQSGTGLGLATAKRIIEEHGGNIEVHSAPGRGTDFIVALPVAGDDQTTLASATH